jgi:hypothetical protein
MGQKPNFTLAWKLAIATIIEAISGVVVNSLGLLEGYNCTVFKIQTPCGWYYFLMASIAFLLLLGIVQISWTEIAKILAKLKEVKNTTSKPHNEKDRVGIEIYNPNKGKITVSVELLSLVYTGEARKDKPIPIQENNKFFKNGNKEIERKDSAIVYLAETRNNNNVVFLLNEPYDNEYLRRFFSQKVTRLAGKEASMSTFRIKVKITAKLGQEIIEETFEDLIRFTKSSTYMKSIDQYYIVTSIFIGNRILEEKGLITYVKKEP